MKNFFTSLLGTLVALVLFFGGAFLLLIGLAVAIGTSARQQPPVTVQKGSYLVFDLAANLQDAPTQVDGSEILAEALGGESGPRKLQLRQVLRALETAAQDERIAGIYLTGSLTPQGYGSGYGALREVREVLLAFRAKKPVVAYLAAADVRDYYLASAASELALDPYGAIWLPGLASEPTFFTGLFEKLGVGVQVARVGEYKSAVEPFIRRDMSPENREQIQTLLGDLWGEIRSAVASARDLTAEEVQRVADQQALLTGEAAVAAKLVDRTAYVDEVYAELKKRTGVGGAKEFKQIALDEYLREIKGEEGSEGTIALVYAEGEIVDGEGDLGQVGGDKLARELRQIRLKDKARAVVLRVNSPGGSVSASEAIQRELKLLRDSGKPVVISMGTVAASGGYWISTASDRIFAEPTTITGSIGVFGVLFNLQELSNKIGLSYDRVKTGHFADAVSLARPKTEEEMALINREVEWIYRQFLGRVAEARGLEMGAVEKLAGGRVWSGADAKELGLVDELGGLESAVRFAAQKAGLGQEYSVEEYPRKKEFADFLNELVEGRKKRRPEAAVAGLLGEVRRTYDTLSSYNDPRGYYARLPFDLMLK